MYICHVFLLLVCALLHCCCCCCCCCWSSCAGLQNMLLWLIAYDSHVFVLFIIQTRYTWQYCRICSFDLPIANDTYHSPHLITGMRGAKAGDRPPRRCPRCIYIYCICITNITCERSQRSGPIHPTLKTVQFTNPFSSASP